MVTRHHYASTVVILSLLWRTNLLTASPLYDNLTTDDGRPRASIDRSASITASDDPSTQAPASLQISSSTFSRNTSSTYTGEPFYVGTSLANSDWEIFRSKTLRPTASISWASSMPEVEKCWSEIVDWRDSSISWWNKYVASTKFSKTVLTTQTMIWGVTETSWEETIYPTSADTYTLCDGSPRVDIRPETRTTTFNVTSSSTHHVPKEFPFPQTQPCVPDPQTCRMWYYESNINVTNRDELFQQCGRPTGLYEPCIVAGGPVQLIYWPEESVEGSVCPNNASHSFRHPSSGRSTLPASLPDTVTALGHTFTSGSVYLSFHTLYASYDGFYDRVGPTFKDTIIPVPSSAMSTHCGGFTEAHGPGTSLNYADLNWPVAASAYNCQARCDNQRFIPRENRTGTPTECHTIWSDVNPNIAIPTLVKDLVPEWASCEMSGFRIPNFWFDPPVKLTNKASIAVPTTLHAEPTTEPAAPSSGLISSAPLETGSAQSSASQHGENGDKSLPSKTPVAEVLPSTRAIALESSVSVGSPVSEHTKEPEPVLIPDAAETAFPGNFDQNTATLVLAPAPEGDEDPTKAWIPRTSTRLFSYQPQTPSLNALSVLESALSAISKSTLQSDVSLEADTTKSAAPPHNLGSSVSVFPPNPDNESPVTTSPISTVPQEPIQIPEDAPQSTADASVISTQRPAEPSQLASEGITLSISASQSNSNAWISTHTTENQESVSPTPDETGEGWIPSVVLASPPEERTLAVGSFTVTAEIVSGSPGAIEVGGTTFAEDGDIATLEGGQVLSFDSSGIAVIHADTTVVMSSVDATGTATSSFGSSSTLVEYPAVTSESEVIESGAEQNLRRNLKWICTMALMVVYEVL